MQISISLFTCLLLIILFYYCTSIKRKMTEKKWYQSFQKDQFWLSNFSSSSLWSILVLFHQKYCYYCNNCYYELKSDNVFQMSFSWTYAKICRFVCSSSVDGFYLLRGGTANQKFTLAKQVNHEHLFSQDRDSKCKTKQFFFQREPRN